MAKKKNLPFNTNPYEPNENLAVKAPAPEVKHKAHKTKTGIRGAQKPQRMDGEPFNRGAAKPWKPPGRK